MKVNKPDLSKIRSIVFWDTTIEKIDWDKHMGFVVMRIFERGTQEEKREITRFYGWKIVLHILRNKRPDWRIS